MNCVYFPFLLFMFQLLSEVNTTVSGLRQQLGSSVVKETASSRLQESTLQLQVQPPLHIQVSVEYSRLSE